jgi:hypothetical protein
MKNGNILLAENPVHEEHKNLFSGNREDWLNKVADFIYDKIEEEFVPVVPRENIKLSIGFMPNGAGGSAIGVCHYENHSQGNFREIFIKPTLGASTLVECIETAQVVAHEVTHAILPVKTGHGPKFARIIKNYLGAEGKPTATTAGPQFTLMIKDFIEELGYLPHSKMIENKEGKGSTTVAVRCTGAETCPGASDKSLAQGWGLIARVSIAVFRKVGDNFRCMACGSSTVVELPERLRKDYQ